MFNAQADQRAGNTTDGTPGAMERSNSTKAEWRRPTITRIDLKRTLFGSGTPTDGSAGDPGSI